MTFSIGLGGIAVAMRNRNYRLYTYGAIPSLIGTWIQRMAMGWLAWELTQSGMWLGLVAFADLAPTVLTAPIAGVVSEIHCTEGQSIEANVPLVMIEPQGEEEDSD